MAVIGTGDGQTATTAITISGVRTPEEGEAAVRAHIARIHPPGIPACASMVRHCEVRARRLQLWRIVTNRVENRCWFDVTAVPQRQLF